jgi:hypothetical protein
MNQCQHGPVLYTPRCTDCEIAALKGENAKLREALRFYADEHSWTGLVHVSVGVWQGWDGTLVANDGGSVARKALGEEK